MIDICIYTCVIDYPWIISINGWDDFLDLMCSHISILKSAHDLLDTQDPIIIIIQLLELFTQLLDLSLIHLTSNVSEDYLLEPVTSLEGLQSNQIDTQFLSVVILQ